MKHQRTWSRVENEAIVADYFAMLRAELTGMPYSKAGHRRALLALLNSRSESSVEWKHRNISAVLTDLGCQYLTGYRPAVEYQGDLLDVVEAALDRNIDLAVLLEGDAKRSVSMPLILDPAAVEVDPPERSEQPISVADAPAVVRRSRPNYLEIEARNRELGKVGEEFVVAFERRRLRERGREDLAAKVEHVAATRGDGDGFDILSYEDSGVERFIEVKTTKYGLYTPFFVTANEVKVSQRYPEQFCLFRLFEFGKSSRLYNLRGSLPVNFALTPSVYVARI